MKIQIHCIMGNLVPSDFGALPILETKSQDFSASVAQIWPPNGDVIVNPWSTPF